MRRTVIVRPVFAPVAFVLLLRHAVMASRTAMKSVLIVVVLVAAVPQEWIARNTAIATAAFAVTAPVHLRPVMMEYVMAVKQMWTVAGNVRLAAAAASAGLMPTA